MKTVNIPGGTATLREAADLRVRDSDLIEAAAAAAAPVLAQLPADALRPPPDGESAEDRAKREVAAAKAAANVKLSMDDALSLLQMRRATVVACLASWTRPEPLPTMDTIGDLPRDVVAALDAAVGGMRVGEDFSPTSEQGTPTGDSWSLSGPSGDDHESNPTSECSAPGGNTDTASSTD